MSACSDAACFLLSGLSGWWLMADGWWPCHSHHHILDQLRPGQPEEPQRLGLGVGVQWWDPPHTLQICGHVRLPTNKGDPTVLSPTWSLSRCAYSIRLFPCPLNLVFLASNTSSFMVNHRRQLGSAPRRFTCLNRRSMRAMPGGVCSEKTNFLLLFFSNSYILTLD